MDDLQSTWCEQVRLLREFARECEAKRPEIQDEIESQAWAFFRMRAPIDGSQLAMRLAAMRGLCRAWNARVGKDRCRSDELERRCRGMTIGSDCDSERAKLRDTLPW